MVELKQEKQNMLIFIGPAIGDVMVNQTKIKTVSQASPFGHLLMGKTTGDSIVFNQKSFSIVNCY
jgi:transcription elongation GreA/GreB family factor